MTHRESPLPPLRPNPRAASDKGSEFIPRLHEDYTGIERARPGPRTLRAPALVRVLRARAGRFLFAW